MAYPTKESNDREGGSPNEEESERLGDYVEDTKDQDMPSGDTGPYTDRNHPHQDAQNRQPGDHPHKHLVQGDR